MRRAMAIRARLTPEERDEVGRVRKRFLDARRSGFSQEFAVKHANGKGELPPPALPEQPPPNTVKSPLKPIGSEAPPPVPPAPPADPSAPLTDEEKARRAMVEIPADDPKDIAWPTLQPLVKSITGQAPRNRDEGEAAVRAEMSRRTQR